MKVIFDNIKSAKMSKTNVPSLPNDVWNYLLNKYMPRLIRVNFLILKCIYRVNKLFYAFFKTRLSNLNEYSMDHCRLYGRNNNYSSIIELERLERYNVVLYKLLKEFGCYYFESLGGYVLHGKQTNRSSVYRNSYYRFNCDNIVFDFGRIVSILKYKPVKYTQYRNKDWVSFYEYYIISITFYPEFKYILKDSDGNYLTIITPEHIIVQDETENKKQIKNSENYYYKKNNYEIYWAIYENSMLPFSDLKLWRKV